MQSDDVVQSDDAVQSADVDAEVLIAGYGPVGAVLAALLGMQGVSVAVVDPEGDPYPLPRAAALDAEVLRTLVRLPGLGRLDDWAVALRRGRVLGPDHKPLFTVEPAGSNPGDSAPGDSAPGDSTPGDSAPGDSTFGLPEGMLIRQPRLEAALRAGISRLPGVEVRAGRSVTAIEQAGDRVVVGLDNGDRVRARWVVGCDGASSTVRALLDIPCDGVTYAEPWLVVDAITDTVVDQLPTFSYVLDPRRPQVAMSQPGAYRWEWLLLPGEDPEQMTGPASVRELISAWVDPDTVRVERAAVFTFHARTAARWRQQRVLLAGDAAHSMPPFVGQGLSAGIRDAVSLAWRLVEVSRGLADPALLDGYERERRPDVRATTALALRMGRILQTRSPALSRLLRTVLRTAGAVPGVESLAGRRAQSRRGLPRGTAGSHPGAGSLLPNPRVRTATGDVVRLDDLLGQRWAIFGLGCDPRTGMDADATKWAAEREATVLTVGTPGEGTDIEDIDRALVPAFSTARGRIGPAVAVVRPDRFLYGVLPAPLKASDLPAEVSGFG